MDNNGLPKKVSTIQWIRCTKCGTMGAYRVIDHKGTKRVRCIACKKIYMEDDLKEFETWFAPIERYITRRFEEPKIEEK